MRLLSVISVALLMFASQSHWHAARPRAMQLPAGTVGRLSRAI